MIQIIAFLYLLMMLGLYTVTAYREAERNPSSATTFVLVMNIISIFALVAII